MKGGKFEGALADNREISPIVKSLSDDDGWAESFLSSAWAFQSLGDIQKAIGCYDSAFILFSKTGDKDGQVRARIDRKSTRSELQSHLNLVCRLLLEKKKKKS